MTDVSRGFDALSEADCRRLLTSTPVGRVVYTSGALPAAVPVTFIVDGDHVVFRTAPGSELDAAVAGAVVAFEIDQIDAPTRSGWSVLVVGRAARVTGPRDIAHLDQLKLDSWIPDQRTNYVRIQIGQISGRVLNGQHPPPPW